MILKEIKVGSDIVLTESELYGKLMSITNSGMYSVRFDIDEYDEPRTYYTKKQFYNSFKKVN